MSQQPPFGDPFYQAHDSAYAPAEMQTAPPPVPLAQPPVPDPNAYRAAGPVATGLAMKARNPWLVWLVWPLITLGIYHLVWYYKIHREMAEFDRRRSIPVAGPMLVLLFLSWTFIAPLVSYYNCGTRIRNIQRSAGLSGSCSPIAGLLLMFLFGAGTLYYQYELNSVTEVYPVPPGTQVPLYA